MSRRGRGSATSVFVRNVHNDARQADLKRMFSKYGDISDVYLPLDYYTRMPRGFAYIQYLFNPVLGTQRTFDYRDDAEDAIHYLDGVELFGRALEVQLAQGDRKTPGQMRTKDGGPSRRRRSYSPSRSRSRSRSPRRRRRSYSRSRSRSPKSPPRYRSRSRSPKRRSRSRSPERRRSRSKSKTP